METTRERELKHKKICRFCLTQQPSKLENIFAKDAKIPLKIQIQALSFEVYSNDGLPAWICMDCRLLFEQSYRFRQMCRRGELLLRQYPLTGEWPEPLPKPICPQLLKTSSPSSSSSSSIQVEVPKTSPIDLPPPPSAIKKQQQQNLSTNTIKPKRKLLNSNPVESPEPPVPVRLKKEKLSEDATNFLDKVENNEEISMDDVQQLLASVVDDDNDEAEFVNVKPKLLNKSSIRILNKDAEIVLEPRISEPLIKRDDDGNVEIITEILDANEPFETEPERIKNAAPVETNVYPCPHCERSFPLRQLRDIHLVNHNRERSFLCASCDKSFFSKYDLQKHSLTHTGDRPFKCTICERSFTRASLLHRHERTHTDIPKFICVYCEKEFISRVEMEKHTERHRKVRPFVCKTCNKAFAFKQGLERHEVVHSREQPYPCQYCDLSFSTPSKLARHLTAHAGIRPYPCKFCPKSFLLSHHLTRHLRSHKQAASLSGYKCFVCLKKYKTLEEHIYHSAVHSTQTLTCTLCQESFSDVNAVTAHITEHVEGETYACAFCDFIFLTQARLQQHTDKDHANELAAYENDKMEGISIEEFLIDELPEGTLALIKDDRANTVQKKDDNNEALETKPNFFLLNDNIDKKLSRTTNENEKKRKPNLNVQQSVAAKIRKVVLTNSTKVPKITEDLNSGGTKSLQNKLPPQNNLPITKIEKEDEEFNSIDNYSNANAQRQSINSVLKALPKSVSVRRNAVAPATPTSSTAATTSSAASAMNKSTQQTAAVEIKPKRIMRGTTSATGTETNPTKKVIIKQQTVDVRKYNNNKSLIEKQGRLQMKDGAVVLTKSRSSK